MSPPAKKMLRIRSICFLLFAITLCDLTLAVAQTAPGGPGEDSQWTTAAKQGIGTANSAKSKVWFTLAQGVMTEVYYPDVATANVQMLQFIVFDSKTKKVETELDDSGGSIDPMYGLTLRYEQRNKAKSGQWEIRKTYWTDPNSNAVLVSVFFLAKRKDLRLFVYYDPSINNSGMHDTGWTQSGALVASDGDKASALVVQDGFGNAVTSGFLGTSDGLTQLRTSGVIKNFDRAENGNVVQCANFRSTPKYDGEYGGWAQLTEISLGFGANADEATQTAKLALKNSFVNDWYKYDAGWRNYLKALPPMDPKYKNQFNMAAMVLKVLEDKTHFGANVASLSIPWGGGANANDDHLAGYHYVWSRDLYEVVTAYIALGDKAAANRALDFLFNFQQKPDGSFPQVSLLDGRPAWGTVQMDEVAYPLILAYQLGRSDKQTYSLHVKPAADYIALNGPSTPQERWEEKAGYSPSTIAAEIAGLVCAADIAKRQDDAASAAKWLSTADDWARNIERWTATTNGKYGDGNYYIRISEKGEPDADHKIELKNNAGTVQENEIVDAGFLELVRLGIKPADDPLIVKSLKIVDQLLKVDTPNGPAFYRYNHDGYGEMNNGRRWNWDGQYTGIGRPWPLLSGERGEYEIAVCASRIADPKPAKPGLSNCIDTAASRLSNMAGFANDGLMIPEQVWDSQPVALPVDRQFVPELKPGEGTGAATPLAWSMAQFIRLATNIKAGRNLETPQVVYERYKNGIPGRSQQYVRIQQ
jgi:glucoamylase